MASSEQSWCLCWRYSSTGFVFACSRSRPAVRSPFLCPPAGLRSRFLCPFSSSSRKVTFFVLDSELRSPFLCREYQELVEIP